jgi:hypothetical protein
MRGWGMKRINATEFVTTFDTLSEPVEVTKRGVLIGTWMPGAEIIAFGAPLLDPAYRVVSRDPDNPKVITHAEIVEVSLVEHVPGSGSHPVTVIHPFGESRPAPKPTTREKKERGFKRG